MTEEVSINIESVRVPPYRDNYGDLTELGDSIQHGMLHHPITVWKDGTLISGARRLRAHFLLAGVPEGSRFRKIRAVFVDTIEDAAKRLLDDNQDDHLALPLGMAEIARLWEVIRKLDEPAAIKRAEASRRRGVEMRKATLSGKRKPGRATNSQDYALGVLGAPFGMSESSASRLWALYMLASAPAQPEERREQARQALRDIDDGISSLWANYSRLLGGTKPPLGKPKAAPTAEPAPAPRQRLAWERSLPQMEGLVAGLIELGPPNPDLTWEQVGPVHARLSAIRRDLEKIIWKMKESAK